jgi:hypothetical protein
MGMRGLNSPLANPNIAASLDDLDQNTFWQRLRRRVFWNGPAKVTKTPKFARGIDTSVDESFVKGLLGESVALPSQRAGSLATAYGIESLEASGEVVIPANFLKFQEALADQARNYPVLRDSSGSIGLASDRNSMDELLAYQVNLFKNFRNSGSF